MSEKTERLLDLLDKATQTDGGPDRALWLLLKQYEAHLPEPDDYFHKAFRQIDVTDSGRIDMAIWHLIGVSKVFWRCFDEAQKPITGNPPDEPSQGTDPQGNKA